MEPPVLYMIHFVWIVLVYYHWDSDTNHFIVIVSIFILILVKLLVIVSFVLVKKKIQFKL